MRPPSALSYWLEGTSIFCWQLGPFGFNLSGHRFFWLWLCQCFQALALLRPKNSAYVSLRGSSHVSAGCGVEPAVWSDTDLDVGGSPDAAAGAVGVTIVGGDPLAVCWLPVMTE